MMTSIQLRKLYIAITLLLLGFLNYRKTEALRFELESGHTKCIAEEIKSNAMSVGNYKIVNPNGDYPLPDSHKITVRVTSTYGNSYHNAEHVTLGQYAFTTAEAGDYLACFYAEAHDPPSKLTIDFEWKTGVAAKDWGNVAKKGSIEVMQLELKKLYDTVISIQEEMYYLREREEQMQDLNRSTNSKMGWLSLVSLLACLSVAGVQFWHLKHFFEKKKLI